MNLLIGSTESSSGKSAFALGLGLHLRASGVPVDYFKPLGTIGRTVDGEVHDEDALFIGSALNVEVRPPLVFLEPAAVRRRLSGQDSADYVSDLAAYLQPPSGTVRLVEAAGAPQEGALFGLTLQSLAEHLPARVLIVCRYRANLVIDHLLALQVELGNRLLGAVLNDVPADQLDDVRTVLVPYLENRGIATFGVLPVDRTLRSLSVASLADALGAEVLCCRDRLDLMVEAFNIGAMSASTALKYFRKTVNKAVITGGDRTDIQLAALETSTACLVLTGHLPPQPGTLARAEQLEVPVLSVGHDTLAAVEIIDRAFAQARFREPVKVGRIRHLLAHHFDLRRFEALLGLSQEV